MVSDIKKIPAASQGNKEGENTHFQETLAILKGALKGRGILGTSFLCLNRSATYGISTNINL